MWWGVDEAHQWERVAWVLFGILVVGLEQGREESV